MKQTLLILSFLLLPLYVMAQETTQEDDSCILDSIYAELPEILVVGERPLVKSEEGKLIYDLPRLVDNTGIDNIYDAIKELPGVIEQNESLTLAGGGVHLVLNGKVSSLSKEQLTTLLKSTPVSMVEKAEMMYASSARYGVRGPMINIVLKKDRQAKPRLQGEIYSLWQQKHYEQLTERASILFSSEKVSSDLLYSYTNGRSLFSMEKEALHTVNNITYPIEMEEEVRVKGDNHNLRWGIDYSLNNDYQLSAVYTMQIADNTSKDKKWGTENSFNRKEAESNLHNISLDFHAGFGLDAGVEFTFYESGGRQNLNSSLNNIDVNVRYDDTQRINKWKFYFNQEHTLSQGWKINYGAHYTTALDNSHQYLFDNNTGSFDPDNSMKVRRNEYSLNGFAGFAKSFNSKLSMDFSLAAELYHTSIWNEWMIYPTLNMTYMLSPSRIWQFSFYSDKSYPAFWEMRNAVSYMGVYTESQGNPELKPSQTYQPSLSYIHKGKYVFTAFFGHTKDYFVQTLYQKPDELLEVYKTVNFDYIQQAGLQATIPFKIKNWLSSRFTLTGLYSRQKDSHFWDTSFDRDNLAIVGTMNNNITFSSKPDLKMNISAFYQSGAIQGIYDLNPSFNLDASLIWTFAKEKAQLVLKGLDVFNTSRIDPVIRFEQQNVTNRFTTNNRGIELSFRYKFGNYQEKQREDVDKSRFKN